MNGKGRSPRIPTAAPWSGRRDWHVARWGPWGWGETAVKLVAVALAVAAAAEDGAWSIPPHHRVAFWTLAAISVAYVAAVADRWIDREIVAMAFVFAMIVGHLAIVRAMGGREWPGGDVRAFAGLMLLGDLLKLVFFVRTGARVRDLPRPVPIVATGLLALLYLVVLFAA